MAIEIVPLNAIQTEQWRFFVDECDECWLYHHPDIAPIDDPDSRSFAILQSGELIGGCLLFVNRSGIGKVLGYRIGAAGLAMKNILTAEDYSEISKYLGQLACSNNCHAIQMLLPTLAPVNLKKNYLESHLAHMGFNNSLRWGTNIDYVPSYTTLIDLANSIDVIFNDFSKSPREKCKKFKKLHFEYKFFNEAVADNEWNNFVTNHNATLERSGGAPLSAKLILKLRGLLHSSRASLINVYFNLKCQASLLILTYKKSGFYFASGIQPEAYESGVSAYIHLLAIKELKSRSFEYYEVGQSFPTLKGTKINTLGEFKRMFGGYKHSVLVGELVVDKGRYIFLDLLPSHLRKFLRYCIKMR